MVLFEYENQFVGALPPAYPCYGCDQASLYCFNMDPNTAHNLRILILDWKAWDYDSLRTALSLTYSDFANGTRYKLFGVSPYWTELHSMQVSYNNSGQPSNVPTTGNGIFWHAQTSWTVEACVYWTSANLSPIITSFGNPGSGYKVGINAAGVFFIQRLSTAVFSLGPGLAGNTAYHLVVVNDAVNGHLFFYVNGALQTTLTPQLPIEAAGTTPIVVEGGDTAGNVMQGFAGQFGVYFRALNATEVGALYTSLTAYWQSTTLQTIALGAQQGQVVGFGVGGAYPVPSYMAPFMEGNFPARWTFKRRVRR